MTTLARWFAVGFITAFVISLSACGSSSSTSSTGPSKPPNPVPTVTSIFPGSIAPTTPSFDLTVEGSNFVAGSVVQWNGTARATTYISSTNLVAKISDDDIKSAGTAAVSIFNPAPGGGRSKPVTFAVEPDRASMWQTVELAFNTQSSYPNPFTDNVVTCEFDGPAGEPLVISAFYDGNGVWRVRFTPTALGSWTYRTTSGNVSDLGLHSISGQLEVTSSASDKPLYTHGGFLKVSSTGRFLTYTDGTPFFWLGDTWWFAPSSLLPIGTDPGFNLLVDTRKQEQFSVAQIAFQGPEWGAMSDSAGSRNLDIAFWQNVDRYFSYANNNGLILAVALKWAGTPLRPIDDWKFLWSYFIARYGSYPVVWIVSGEYNVFNDPDQVAQALAVGQFIKDNDPYKRAMSIHAWYYGNEQHQAWSEPWYDFVMIQGGHVYPPVVPSADAYTTPYALTPPKPLLEDECDYEGIFGGTPNVITATQVRRVAYHALQMGSFGFTYGANGVWYPTQSATDDTFWSDWGTSLPYWEAVNLPGARQMQILRNLYASVEWWKLEPRSEYLTYQGASLPDTPFQAWASGMQDSLYIIYFPQGADPTAAYTLTLKTVSEQIFSAKWFDPQTGISTPISATVSCSGGICSLPARMSSDDWALILTAQ